MEPAVWRRKVNYLLIGLVVVLLIQHAFFPLGPFENVEGIAVFILSALSLIPLAGFLESAVEELAELWGPFLGGLLHTTASNVAELTISVALLLSIPANAEISASNVVMNSIAGVIIRNSLLFLGLATLLGCLKNGRMKFDARNAGEYSTIFSLAVIGVGLPTLGVYILGPSAANEAFLGLHIGGRAIPLPEVLAGLLLLIYAAYILFVVLHVGRPGDDMGSEEVEEKKDFTAMRGLNLNPDQSNAGALFVEERERALSEEQGQTAALALTPTAAATLTAPAKKRKQPSGRTYAKGKLLEARKQRREAAGERRILEDHPRLRGLVAVLVLALSTALVALMSEAFANSVEEIFHNHPVLLGLPTGTLEFFLGLIFIPILAGMVELYGSVGMAREDKMEITIAITAGATIQMILLVVPIIVIVGALTGHPLNLVFAPITVIIFGAATFTFMLLSRDGESTVLEGVQLCALWLLIAVIAFFLPPTFG